MAERTDPASTKGTIAPDTRVEVRTEFDRSWSPGFTVVERTAGGYRLRRLSDGQVLPRVIPFDDVRRERRDLWWI